MRPWFIHYTVPENISIFGGQEISIPAYFFFLLLGFLLATTVVIREGKRTSENVRALLDLAIVFMFSGLIGGRLGHIVFEMPSLYIEHPEYILQFWRGGLVFYGGFLFSVIACIVFCFMKKLNFWRVADIYAPATAFGLVFGRLGCLSAGCCYGKVADFPFGITVPWAIAFYSGQVPKELQGVLIHPVQIYEALASILIYMFLINLRVKQKFEGQILIAFLSIYAIWRSIVEIFRFDNDRGVYLNGLLSTSQLISISLIITSIILWVKLKNNNESYKTAT